MQTYARHVVLTLALLCSACGAREDGTADDEMPEANGTAPDAQPAPVAPAGPDLPPRAPARADTVMIEGMPEVSEHSLVSSPAGFAVPFSTYVPEGLEAEFAMPGTARFVAAFGGTRNEKAYMEVRAEAEGSAQAADVVRGLMAEHDVREHETIATDRPSWAQDAMNFRAVAADGTRIVGGVVIVEHGGSHIRIIRHYPAEYGDGLAPRLQTILSEWRWEDTGTMLMQHAAR